MQLESFLILFCTISVLFVGLNDGTTTKSTTTNTAASIEATKSTTTKTIASIEATKSTTTKTTAPTAKQKITTQAKPILVGARKPWETKINPKYKKIFDDYKNITLKKLQEIHKVPKTFVPKPEKFSTQVVGGINYLYLVKLPTNKYAFVSIYHVPWKKNHYGKEENVQIRPQTYELNDKNI